MTLRDKPDGPLPRPGGGGCFGTTIMMVTFLLLLVGAVVFVLFPDQIDFRCHCRNGLCPDASRSVPEGETKAEMHYWSIQ